MLWRISMNINEILQLFRALTRAPPHFSISSYAPAIGWQKLFQAAITTASNVVATIWLLLSSFLLSRKLLNVDFFKSALLCRRVAKRSFFENRRQSVEKASYGFLDIRNDDSSSQIVATTLLAVVIAAWNSSCQPIGINMNWSGRNIEIWTRWEFAPELCIKTSNGDAKHCSFPWVIYPMSGTM